MLIHCSGRLVVCQLNSTTELSSTTESQGNYSSGSGPLFCNSRPLALFMFVPVMTPGELLLSSPGHCGDNCLDYNTNYLSWQPGGIGRMLVFLSLQGVVYLSIIFMVESGIFRWVNIHALPTKIQYVIGID